MPDKKIYICLWLVFRKISYLFPKAHRNYSSHNTKIYIFYVKLRELKGSKIYNLMYMIKEGRPMHLQLLLCTYQEDSTPSHILDCFSYHNLFQSIGSETFCKLVYLHMFYAIFFSIKSQKFYIYHFINIIIYT